MTPGIELPGAHDDRPLILLVTSGYHWYREYLLRSVADAARVWLLQDRPPTWEQRYIVGYTVVDTLDLAALTGAAREVAQAHRVAGVLCWDEIKMVLTAEVARALELPGPDPDAVCRCRDKHLTRAALAALGVPQAASVLVTDRQHALEVAAAIGYPVVLKPRALGASIGVVRVDSPEQLAASWAVARTAFEDGVPYYDAGVLVEEYLDGSEISIDSVIHHGRVTPLFLARKTCGFPPYFEETGHTVDATDPLLADPHVLDVLTRAHSAVGYDGGVTHAEIKLTADGPKIIEINARLGGDLIPYLGLLATGIDSGRVAVEACCGAVPSVRGTKSQAGAIQFFYPEEDVVVDELAIDAALLPPAVVAAQPLAAPGQQLRLPPAGHVTSRHAYAVAQGDTVAECLAALASAGRAIRLRARTGPVAATAS